MCLMMMTDTYCYCSVFCAQNRIQQRQPQHSHWEREGGKEEEQAHETEISIADITISTTYLRNSFYQKRTRESERLSESDVNLPLQYWRCVYDMLCECENWNIRCKRFKHWFRFFATAFASGLFQQLHWKPRSFQTKLIIVQIIVQREIESHHQYGAECTISLCVVWRCYAWCMPLYWFGRIVILHPDAQCVPSHTREMK